MTLVKVMYATRVASFSGENGNLVTKKLTIDNSDEK
jgi:hypothetical protein